ncbi:helix-turn-helix transcriptional regulator [Actinacidiphila oryziradicis]|uniref:Helix-turn-helix transcriptional regulator n=1 Tax=Actinacidiphila oryziradicis TaxID=2571141 RepID=A0A4U0S116_9ACTN|nr:helix-turn-helix transcriptional regulator [Actinacidiphila oryziradicis]TKA01657.1 helix-turn-helix transcriptional regulator [Actinacidiphila oryziradicis]
MAPSRAHVRSPRRSSTRRGVCGAVAPRVGWCSPVRMSSTDRSVFMIDHRRTCLIASNGKRGDIGEDRERVMAVRWPPASRAGRLSSVRAKRTAGTVARGQGRASTAGEILKRLGVHGEARRFQGPLRAAGARRRWAAAPPRSTHGREAPTEAECRVARLIAQGHTDRSAEAELVLSPNRVATHLRSAFGKLKVTSRVWLAMAVLSDGWGRARAGAPCYGRARCRLGAARTYVS